MLRKLKPIALLANTGAVIFGFTYLINIVTGAVEPNRYIVGVMPVVLIACMGMTIFTD